MTDEPVLAYWASTQRCPACTTKTLVIEWRGAVPIVKCTRCGTEGQGRWQ